jgi:hypothetical protein
MCDHQTTQLLCFGSSPCFPCSVTLQYPTSGFLLYIYNQNTSNQSQGVKFNYPSLSELPATRRTLSVGLCQVSRGTYVVQLRPLNALKVHSGSELPVQGRSGITAAAERPDPSPKLLAAAALCFISGHV